MVVREVSRRLADMGRHEAAAEVLRAADQPEEAVAVAVAGGAWEKARESARGHVHLSEKVSCGSLPKHTITKCKLTVVMRRTKESQGTTNVYTTKSDHSLTSCYGCSASGRERLPAASHAWRGHRRAAADGADQRRARHSRAKVSTYVAGPIHQHEAGGGTMTRVE